MTEAGHAFVDRMRIVTQMCQAGTPIFPAMASGLEDDDWLLVYIAVRKMVVDIETRDCGKTGP
jgi:hypothetical protein